MDATAPPAHAAAAPDSGQPILYLRRATAWFLDGLIVSIPVIAFTVAASLVTVVLVGASFGAAGGGLNGLVAGSTVGISASMLLVLAIVVASTIAPVLYLAWAVRRTGEHRGQTFGQELLSVRVERSTVPGPVRTRTLILRACALWTWVGALFALASAVDLMLGGRGLGTFIALGAAIVIAWRAPAGRLPHDRMTGTRVADLSR